MHNTSAFSEVTSMHVPGLCGVWSMGLCLSDISGSRAVYGAPEHVDSLAFSLAISLAFLLKN